MSDGGSELRFLRRCLMPRAKRRSTRRVVRRLVAGFAKPLAPEFVARLVAWVVSIQRSEPFAGLAVDRAGEVAPPERRGDGIPETALSPALWRRVVPGGRPTLHGWFVGSRHRSAGLRMVEGRADTTRRDRTRHGGSAASREGACMRAQETLGALRGATGREAELSLGQTGSAAGLSGGRGERKSAVGCSPRSTAPNKPHRLVDHEREEEVPALPSASRL